MTLLASWLEREIANRELSLRAVEAGTGVSATTLSGILRKNHVPKPRTLLRLSTFFGAPPEQLLSLAADLPYRTEPLAGPTDDVEDGFLVREILAEFRKIPDAWKSEALAQMQLLVRLSQRPPMRIIGGEEEPDET